MTSLIFVKRKEYSLYNENNIQIKHYLIGEKSNLYINTSIVKKYSFF